MQTRFDAIGLVVDDLARSIAFYRQLGLEFPAEAEQGPHAEAALPGGLRLMLDTVEMVRSMEPDWQPARGGQRFGLAFLVDSPAEVDAAYEKLVALGYEGRRPPFDAPWGQRYATVDDPDGNGVDLFSPLG